MTTPASNDNDESTSAFRFRRRGFSPSREKISRLLSDEDRADIVEKLINPALLGPPIDPNELLDEIEDAFEKLQADKETEEDSESTKGHRLTVVFMDPTYKILNELAAKKEYSKAEVLRYGLRLAQYFESVKEDGGHILVERDGKTREIVIP